MHGGTYAFSGRDHLLGTHQCTGAGPCLQNWLGMEEGYMLRLSKRWSLEAVWLSSIHSTGQRVIHTIYHFMYWGFFFLIIGHDKNVNTTLSKIAMKHSADWNAQIKWRQCRRSENCSKRWAKPPESILTLLSTVLSSVQCTSKNHKLEQTAMLPAGHSNC